MSSAPVQRLSRDEYLALERRSELRHQFFNGEMFAMSGASRIHNLIALNLGAELRNQLREKSCEVYTSDMRVLVDATGMYTYPDVVVVCGEPQLEDKHLDTLLNPTVIVEVLSESTAAFDRGRKFAHYQRIASLREYVLIEQEMVRVELYERQGESWLLTSREDPDASLELPAIGCSVPLREIYARTGLIG